ncbi:MAG: hypothetical protein ACFFAU_19185 [Candidatus Hodarchaeota archaeon]
MTEISILRIFKFWTWFKRGKKKTPSSPPKIDPPPEKEEEEKKKPKIGDPPVEPPDDITPIPYGKRLKRVKLFAQVYHGPMDEKVPAKIKDDHWLTFRTSDRKKHEKLIADPPKTHEYTSGILFLKRRVRELVFHTGYQAEATHDPARCQYDIPIIEGQIKMTKSITKTDILKAAADQVKAGLSWSDFIIPGMFFLIICLLIFAYAIQPNM